MARVKSSGTRPERLLRSALWKRGLRYRLHEKLPGSPDIAFVSDRLAIFVDGCFWHGCPVHYTEPRTNTAFWRAKLQRNAERDQRVDRELSAAGWRVLRIWEHEVHDDLDHVADRVVSVLDDIRHEQHS